ncbi:MAG: hypothetical protein F6J90_13220 [Moorea sp. SIOASIH]|uniref:hypothetical protein n=1 Tax=Moorena sp. SIOASIH TaxID=2607817 RepID=UPI0013B84397|nr:hypothetical protein [Moorena sp. SIOASIH]NEO37228.1 hypothetical protein [Moorena sp. SIOASIH]
MRYTTLFPCCLLPVGYSLKSKIYLPYFRNAIYLYIYSTVAGLPMLSQLLSQQVTESHALCQVSGSKPWEKI